MIISMKRYVVLSSLLPFCFFLYKGVYFEVVHHFLFFTLVRNSCVPFYRRYRFLMSSTKVILIF